MSSCSYKVKIEVVIYKYDCCEEHAMEHVLKDFKHLSKYDWETLHASPISCEKVAHDPLLDYSHS